MAAQLLKPQIRQCGYFFISLLPALGAPSFDISFFGSFLDVESLDMPEVLLFMEPFSVLFMPGLFISLLWALAGAPVFWAKAEPHMRVKAVIAISFFIRCFP